MPLPTKRQCDTTRFLHTLSALRANDVRVGIRCFIAALFRRACGDHIGPHLGELEQVQPVARGSCTRSLKAVPESVPAGGTNVVLRHTARNRSSAKFSRNM